MLNKIIKLLIRFKLRRDPGWIGTSFGLNDNTDVHVLVERWYTVGDKSFHSFGTKIEEIGGGKDE
jgi:hypothetical protein